MKRELVTRKVNCGAVGFPGPATTSNGHRVSTAVSRLNGLEAVAHDFIYGDVFDWLARFARKLRRFDVILLDPPTFSSSKESGVFRAEKDYGRLVSLALPLLKSGGVLFASTNAAGISPEQFVGTLLKTITAAGRTVTQSHYVPQPPDFPISRAEPAHLKTVWLKLA